MSRNLAITALFSLLLVGSAHAGTARVNDVLVLNGNQLDVDPVGGFNETTADIAWQHEYLKHFPIDFLKLDEIYRQANRDELANGGDDAHLTERAIAIPQSATCLACMVTRLAHRLSNSRMDAYVDCSRDCRDAGIQFSSLKENVKRYWLVAGIGAYEAGSYAYDIWVQYGW